MISFDSVVEEGAIGYLEELGYFYVAGPDLAPDGVSPEQQSYADDRTSSTDPSFEPLVRVDLKKGDLAIIADNVEVLP